MNKKILILFGALDLITFIVNFSYATNYFVRIGFDPLIIGFLILYLSLPISGLLLLKHKKAGIWINYFQMPLRFLFMTLSFGFILKITRLLDNGVGMYDALMWVIIALEVLRFIITIQIHRKYYIAI